MNVTLYLVVQGKPSRFNRNACDVGQLRLTRKKPDTAADEIAIRALKVQGVE